jgi:hypothetical protein
MIDDPAGALGQVQHRAHARDIGAQAAEQRQPQLGQEVGRMRDGRLERHGRATDRRLHSLDRAREFGLGHPAGRPRHAQRAALGLDYQVVASERAERADDILDRPQRRHRPMPPWLIV